MTVTTKSGERERIEGNEKRGKWWERGEKRRRKAERKIRNKRKRNESGDKKVKRRKKPSGKTRRGKEKEQRRKWWPKNVREEKNWGEKKKIEERKQRRQHTHTHTHTHTDISLDAPPLSHTNTQRAAYRCGHPYTWGDFASPICLRGMWKSYSNIHPLVSEQTEPHDPPDTAAEPHQSCNFNPANTDPPP